MKATYKEKESMKATLVEMEVYETLRTILKNKKSRALNYCVNYAIEGLTMTGEDLKIQVLYVLNNMIYWHGEEAKEVRKILKKYTKR